MFKQAHRSLFGILLIILMLYGCAGTVRQDLSVVDRAKLDAKALTIWYTAMYQSILQILADPTVPPSVKKVIKRRVNPTMNHLKRTLIAYIEAIKAAEAAQKASNQYGSDQVTKIVMLQMELNKMVTNILNDLTYLGLAGRTQPVAREVTKNGVNNGDNGTHTR